MRNIHLVVGEANATHIQQALESYEISDSEVLPLLDNYSYGPLRKPDIPFSLLRNQYWNGLKNNLTDNYELRDLENVLDLIKAGEGVEGEVLLHFWMSDKACEILAYYFLLHYLKPLMGQLHVININGLPFLNDDLQMYYPKSFTDINHKGISKALKLSRAITTSEFEADADEWKFFQQHPCNVRVAEGGKKIAVHEDDFYDQKIIDAIKLMPNKKWKRVLPQILPLYSEYDELFFNERLQLLLNKELIKVDNGNLVVVEQS